MPYPSFASKEQTSSSLLALSTMMIPFEMTMIPQYLLFSKLGLVDNYLAFYLPAMNYAFGTF